MTRGTLFYYESDENVWSSTEFNGDMYHGTPEEPEGEGDKVIELMSGLKSLNDFKKVLKEINKDYGYKEGNNCWSVSDEAIAEESKQAIEWIENERPDLKGNDNFDPRAMERIPTFKDTRTWHYWGTPNLSDYSYIYNNSGKDLVIKTDSKPIKMVIPDGALGVLCFGSKDCICKDGKIIDGMGNYKEHEETEKSEEAPTMNADEFYDYIIENFTLDGTSRSLVRNIIDYVSKTNNGENTYTLLNWLLDGIGLEDSELRRVQM